MPATPGQPDALNHNSLAYEDKLLLQLAHRAAEEPARLLAAARRAAACTCCRTPDIEKADPERGEFVTRTPFVYTETRGDESQRYAAIAWHTLLWSDERLRIRLKRVDLLNCDAALPSIQLFL